MSGAEKGTDDGALDTKEHRLYSCPASDTTHEEYHRDFSTGLDSARVGAACCPPPSQRVLNCPGLRLHEVKAHLLLLLLQKLPTQQQKAHDS